MKTVNVVKSQPLHNGVLEQLWGIHWSLPNHSRPGVGYSKSINICTAAYVLWV